MSKLESLKFKDAIVVQFEDHLYVSKMKNDIYRRQATVGVIKVGTVHSSSQKDGKRLCLSNGLWNMKIILYDFQLN